MAIIGEWTYAGNPAESSSAAVRFMVGDTDSADPQLSDAEVAYALAQNGSSVERAAIACCEFLQAKYARLVNMSVEGLSYSYALRVKHYADLASSIRRKAAFSLLTPYAGGISRSDKTTDEADSDRRPPAFRVGMHDDPAASDLESTSE